MSRRKRSLAISGGFDGDVHIRIHIGSFSGLDERQKGVRLKQYNCLLASQS